MRASQYLIEPHAPWVPRWRGVDIVVAVDDADALRQSRARVAAGDVYRYAPTIVAEPGRAPALYSRLVYVARFFAWERR